MPKIYRWVDADRTTITDGEGKYIPVDPNNRDYVEIVTNNEQIRDPEVLVSAENIKKEAERRIIKRTESADLFRSIIKQLNSNMRYLELLEKRIDGHTLTGKELSDLTRCKALNRDITEIYEISNELEQNITEDFKSDKHWSKKN